MLIILNSFSLWLESKVEKQKSKTDHCADCLRVIKFVFTHGFIFKVKGFRQDLIRLFVQFFYRLQLKLEAIDLFDLICKLFKI